MPIKLNSSGGGSVTLDVPSTGSSFNLTAPPRNGNIITSGDSGTISTGMIASGAVTPSLISPGSVGQGLVTNSSGSTAWTSGGWTLITTLQGLNVGSLASSNCFTSNYTYYQIMFNFVVPSVNGAYGMFRVFSDGAYQSANYVYGQIIPSNYTWSSSTSFGLLTWPSGASVSSNGGYGGMNGFLNVGAPTDTGYYKGFTGMMGYYYPSNGVDLTACNSFRWQGSGSAVTGFQVFFSSGNVAAGNIRVYGWN